MLFKAVINIAVDLLLLTLFTHVCWIFFLSFLFLVKALLQMLQLCISIHLFVELVRIGIGEGTNYMILAEFTEFLTKQKNYKTLLL